ncbi:hypothetical protein EB061_01900 [bacterium]|nr:hypothetical protein [bacterium]
MQYSLRKSYFLAFFLAVFFLAVFFFAAFFLAILFFLHWVIYCLGNSLQFRCYSASGEDQAFICFFFEIFSKVIADTLRSV